MRSRALADCNGHRDRRGLARNGAGRSSGRTNQKVEPLPGRLVTRLAPHAFDKLLADGQAQAGAAEAAGHG